MSTHEVKVIRIPEIKPHPNADSLGLVDVDGWTCVVKLGTWNPGDLAAYIEPDYTVPLDRPEFAFLGGEGVKPGDRARIKAKRLRGVWSQGLLVPAPVGSGLGYDVREWLGVERYEPPMVGSGGRPGASLGPAPDQAEPPPGLAGLPKYDLENWQKFRDVIVEGESVVITEKLHGANARYVCVDGELHVGSRTRWLKRNPDAPSPWHRALDQNAWISDWCVAHPGLVLYGEIFGAVQDLKYGAAEGQIMFRAFDVSWGAEFLDSWRVTSTAISRPLTLDEFAPIVYVGPMPDEETLRALAEGPSLIPGAKHNREGIVIKPEDERHHPRLGRVALKLVSNWYLSR